MKPNTDGVLIGHGEDGIFVEGGDSPDPVIAAFNEGGHNSTRVPVSMILKWVVEHRQDLLVKAMIGPVHIPARIDLQEPGKGPFSFPAYRVNFDEPPRDTVREVFERSIGKTVGQMMHPTPKLDAAARKLEFLKNTYCRMTCKGGSERGTCPCPSPKECEYPGLRAKP